MVVVLRLILISFTHFVFCITDTQQDATCILLHNSVAEHVKPPPPSYLVPFIFNFTFSASHSKDANSFFHVFLYYTEMIVVDILLVVIGELLINELAVELEFLNKEMKNHSFTTCAF